MMAADNKSRRNFNDKVITCIGYLCENQNCKHLIKESNIMLFYVPKIPDINCLVADTLLPIRRLAISTCSV